MPDESQPLVSIKLDKERHLRLTLRGIIKFQEITGKNLLKGFALKDINTEDLGALLWACLIHEDKDLKYDDVLDMVDISNLMAVKEAVVECIIKSFPEVEKSKAPLAKRRPRG